jgi:hypothetical protein
LATKFYDAKDTANYDSGLQKYKVDTRKKVYYDDKNITNRIGIAFIGSNKAGISTDIKDYSAIAQPTFIDAGTGKTTMIPAKDVTFELKYNPVTAATYDAEYVKQVEKDLAGFKFVATASEAGSLESLDTFAQAKDLVIEGKTFVHRPVTYFDWASKAGTVQIDIIAVDEEGEVISYIAKDTATLNFRQHDETEININIYKVENGKEVKVDKIKVAEKETVEVYHLNNLITRVFITDENNNGYEPTYANGYADLEWYSGDPTIARVTKDGRITGIKAGTVTVYAKGKFKTGELQVEVTGKAKGPKVRFNQDPAKYQIPVGSTRPVSAYVITDPIRNYDYTVVSADPTIVAIVSKDEEDLKKYNDDVDDNWFIKGVNKGTTYITVTPFGSDEGITAEITVVEDLKGYSFNKETYTVAKGKTVTLYGKTNPLDAAFDANDYDVIVDNTSIASAIFEEVYVESKNEYTYDDKGNVVSQKYVR